MEGGAAGVVVHVDLAHEQAPLELPGGVFEGGCDHAAGATPGGPEVDHHGDRGLGDKPLQVIVAQFDRVVRGRKRGFTGSAAPSSEDPGDRDPVGLAAPAAAEYKRVTHVRQDTTPAVA